jgi:hypothetical protein
MNEELKRRESKQHYEPPKLVTINLRPEEAVLGFCKVSGGGGAGGICGITCMTIGS